MKPVISTKLKKLADVSLLELFLAFYVTYAALAVTTHIGTSTYLPALFEQIRTAIMVPTQVMYRDSAFFAMVLVFLLQVQRKRTKKDLKPYRSCVYLALAITIFSCAGLVPA